MVEDDFTVLDVEHATAHGRIRKRETNDPRGTRWEIVGPAEDGREIGVVVRMLKPDGVLISPSTKGNGQNAHNIDHAGSL